MEADTPFDIANDVLAQAESWMNAGRELAIITMVAGEGIATGLVGQRMIIAADGAVFGSLGPCISDASAREMAKAVIASGEPHLLDLTQADGHARLYVERLG